MLAAFFIFHFASRSDSWVGVDGMPIWLNSSGRGGGGGAKLKDKLLIIFFRIFLNFWLFFFEYFKTFDYFLEYFMKTTKSDWAAEAGGEEVNKIEKEKIFV